jgi:DNA adenine methylase
MSMMADEMKHKKSFLKWPGGKYRLLNTLLPLFLKTRKAKFIEPFAGSGVVFLNVNFPRYVLADCNTINIFRDLELRGEDLIQEAKKLFENSNNPKRYYELRAEFNELKNEYNTLSDSFRKSAIFIYLNRHCFNGLFRLNKKGEFNVPFGKYKSVYFPEKELKNFCYKLMNNQVDMYSDYRTAMERASNRDVVYCDPPYVPINKSGFTTYSGDGFSKENQEELAELAKMAFQRGAMVLISNHDTEFTRQLYESANIIEVDVRRSISANAEGRKEVKEIIAVFA